MRAFETEPGAAQSATRPPRLVWFNLAGVITGLLLIESLALFHIVDYRESSWFSDTGFDPELKAVRRPYTREAGSAVGGDFAEAYKIPASDRSKYEWDLKFDHNGFRNGTDLKQADIVVLGSSFIEGTTIPDSGLITSVLARRTHRVVENLAHSAYGPQQDLVALKRYGLPLHPRVVISTFTEFIEPQQEGAYRSETRYGKTFWSSFLDRSFTRSFYRKVRTYFKGVSNQARQAFEPENAQAIKRSGVVRDAQGNPRRIYFLHPALPLSRDDLGALNRTVDIIAAGQKLAAAQGARLVVVFIPDQFRVFHSFAQIAPGCECRQWVVNEEPQLLESALKSKSPDIGFLDLTPVMTDAVKSGIIPHYSDDNHWSPAGHRLAAEAIAAYLARQAW
jgi:hypothetical protein